MKSDTQNYCVSNVSSGLRSVQTDPTLIIQALNDSSADKHANIHHTKQDYLKIHNR